MSAGRPRRAVGIVIGEVAENPDGSVVLLEGHGWCLTPPPYWYRAVGRARRWAHIAWAGWSR